MHTTRCRILMAATLAGLGGLLVWSVSRPTGPGVSLYLTGYVTNRQDRVPQERPVGRSVFALVSITNGTGRLLTYTEPEQMTSHFFTTTDGALVHGSIIPNSITLEPAQGSNFTVWMDTSSQPREFKLDYSLSSLADPILRLMPEWLSDTRPMYRLSYWLHPTRSVSLTIPGSVTNEPR